MACSTFTYPFVLAVCCGFTFVDGSGSFSCGFGSSVFGISVGFVGSGSFSVWVSVDVSSIAYFAIQPVYFWVSTYTQLFAVWITLTDASTSSSSITDAYKTGIIYSLDVFFIL